MIRSLISGFICGAVLAFTGLGVSYVGYKVVDALLPPHEQHTKCQ